METRQTRYTSSKGLAFAEQGEMDKLSLLSEEGQYVPRKNEKENRDIFADGGWNYVCSAGEQLFSP